MTDDLRARFHQVIQGTWEMVSADLDGIEDWVGTDARIVGVILDNDFLEQYGDDPALVTWFRALDREDQEDLVRAILGLKARAQEIEAILDDLLRGTRFWSGGWADHPSFVLLVEHGRAVLPALLTRLMKTKDNPWPLFTLSHEILDDGPTIPPEDAGRLSPVRVAWIEMLRREIS